MMRSLHDEVAVTSWWRPGSHDEVASWQGPGSHDEVASWQGCFMMRSLHDKVTSWQGHFMMSSFCDEILLCRHQVWNSKCINNIMNFKFKKKDWLSQPYSHDEVIVTLLSMMRLFHVDIKYGRALDPVIILFVEFVTLQHHLCMKR